MNNQPLVSILMSVYNDRGDLAKTIESVLSQTYSNYEFLIVNDCSEDDTGEIISKFATKDYRIINITNKENLGLTKSLNIAKRKAKGMYIARIDEGDQWYPGKLKIQVEFLSKNADYTIVGSQVININPHNGSNVSVMPVSDYLIRKDLIKGLTPLIHPSVVFRSIDIFYNECADTSQDYELYTRLSLVGKMYNINIPLLSVQRSSSAISNLKSHRQFFNHLIIYDEFVGTVLNKENVKSYIINGAYMDKNLIFRQIREGIFYIVIKILDKVADRKSLFYKYFRTILIPDILFFKIKCLYNLRFMHRINWFFNGESYRFYNANIVKDKNMSH